MIEKKTKGAFHYKLKHTKNEEKTTIFLGGGSVPECISLITSNLGLKLMAMDPNTGKPRNKGMERGANVDDCVEKKIDAMKADPATDPDLAASVKTQEWVDVPVFGSSCRPDVIVGTPPNCQGCYDIKTSCPPLPADAPEPRWPVYGDGEWSNRHDCMTRKASKEDWYGYTQKDIAHLATGAEPVMIHSNSNACK